ncbi:putative odorant receptor 19b [Drosophila subpulchrella]|uniref:putative odorant receptor 19b n=1 Tax=Drosophila subpulchrella TaxID=1486046 RepID=UPI0018A1758D|nr:putative odorant receptor 19b [Drosophila subpulchrella]
MCRTMEIQEVDSTRALVSHWRIFRITGLHPPPKETLWGRHYSTYSIVWNVAFHFCVWLSFSVNFMMSNSLETFSESLCVALPHTLYMMKSFNVYLHRDEMLHSHRMLRHLDRRLSSPIDARIIVEGVAKAKFMFRVLLRCVAGVVFLGILYIAMASEPTLMYPSWIPWNWKDTTAAFLPTVILHTFALMETSMVVLNSTTYPGTYLILVSAHTKALAWRVARLGNDQPLPADRMQELLIGYIQDHQVILKLFQSLQKFLSMSCSMQFLSTACAQCTICYFLLFGQVGVMRFTNMMALFIAFTTDTLLLCSMAELLCQEGETLLAAVYSCNWVDQSVQFRRLHLQMLKRCQKPLILVAGKIMPISMKTFLKMIKGAYTMLTLLNEMRKTSLESN